MVTHFVEESNKMKMLVGLNIIRNISYFNETHFREVI